MGVHSGLSADMRQCEIDGIQPQQYSDMTATGEPEAARRREKILQSQENRQLLQRRQINCRLIFRL